MGPTRPTPRPADGAPSTARAARTGRAGFTLVELLTIVAIIGMVVSVVTLSTEALLPGERLNTSVRELASELMTVRSEAISRNMEYRIEYDLDGERYRIATPFRIDGGRIITFRDDSDEEMRFYTTWQKLKPGVGIQSVIIGPDEYTRGVVFVAFDALGAVSEHSVVLTQEEYGNSFTIEVNGLTGLVRMHEGLYLRELPDDADFD